MFNEINKYAKDEIWISPPIFSQEQEVIKNPNGNGLLTEHKRVDEEGFFNVLWDISNKVNGKSSFEIYLLFFDEVCLTAFSDEVMASIIEAESTATEYKGAVGSLLDEDVRFGLLGFHMEYQELLDSFNIIRRAKMDYERYRSDKAKQESDSK